MSRQDEQRALLEGLRRMGSHGRAEAEDKESFARRFWPVPAHLRAFEPDSVLVVGPRGSGKTALFRSITDYNLLPRLQDALPSFRWPSLERVDWLKAFPIGTDFPDEIVLGRFLRDVGDPVEAAQEVWLAYLVRTLRAELVGAGLEELFAPEAGDLQGVLGAFRARAEQAMLALDRLERRLKDEGRHVFVAYDELDTLVRSDPERVQEMVGGLVALWSSRARRWERLRAKIFLRKDLYDRAGRSGGADFAKLASGRAELHWSDRDLYAMLIRRIANSGDGESLRSYASAAKVRFEERSDLGWFPLIESVAAGRPLIERMVGVYMGANERKGLTYRWVLDHVRDGRGEALPRPLVRLFEIAAERQAAPPRWPRLLEPKSLRQALDEVSREHVVAARDEWFWIDGLKAVLGVQREVPWERREIEKLLREGLKAWPGGHQPPAGEARALLGYLVEIGVFRERSDGRVDVPDLYLEGLRLKRKGGVGR